MMEPLWWFGAELQPAVFYQSKLIENRNVLADSDLQCNAIVYCIKEYLDRKAHNATQSVMDWPPKSPNLKVNVAGSQYPKKVLNVLQEFWRNISEDYLK